MSILLHTVTLLHVTSRMHSRYYGTNPLYSTLTNVLFHHPSSQQ